MNTKDPLFSLVLIISLLTFSVIMAHILTFFQGWWEVVKLEKETKARLDIVTSNPDFTANSFKLEIIRGSWNFWINDIFFPYIKLDTIDLTDELKILLLEQNMTYVDMENLLKQSHSLGFLPWQSMEICLTEYVVYEWSRDEGLKFKAHFDGYKAFYFLKNLVKAAT